MEIISVTVQGMKMTCNEGMSLYDLEKEVKAKIGREGAIVAKVNGLVKELFYEVEPDSNVEFCYYDSDLGKDTYERGLTMVMLRALYKELPRKDFKKITVEYCIDTGYYCTLNDRTPMDDELIERIERRMHEYVEDDRRFIKETMSVDRAIALFNERKMFDKSNLIRYRTSSRVNVYWLGKVADYFYGPMPYSTGVLKLFRLEKFDDGFVFIIPKKDAMDVLPEFNPSMKLHRTLKETADWGVRIGSENVGKLNDIIVNNGMREMILVQEAFHEKRIGDIAEEIASRENVKVVTIAGPSSSGKTTFSYRLSAQLKTLGLRPHPIGLDDYFVNRVDTPLDEDGKYDYECIDAIDTKLFNEDLTKLLNGEEVQLPTYNFITGEREYNKPIMKLEEDEILVIEGIHGLNDKLTEKIEDKYKFKIYISALTALNVDYHNRISTTDGRLIRRIARDARTRGHSAQKTLEMWASVRRGENNNIFPFQEKADAVFNSSLVYETPVLKTFVEPLLHRVPRDCPEYVEARRLLKFLDYFLAINPQEVPLNSIVREFIGGGVILD